MVTAFAILAMFQKVEADLEPHHALDFKSLFFGKRLGQRQNAKKKQCNIFGKHGNQLKHSDQSTNQLFVAQPDQTRTGLQSRGPNSGTRVLVIFSSLDKAYILS